MKHLFFCVHSFFSQPLVKAVSLLFSTIVGAGVLSVPYVVAHTGLLIGSFYIVGVGVIMLAIHLIIAELVIRFGKHAQLTGLIRTYVGARGAWVMAMVFLVLHMGALVAYLIGEGTSLAALFGGPSFIWATLFFIFAVGVIGYGTRAIAQFDGVVNVITTATLLYIVCSALKHIQVPVRSFFPDATLSPLVPYGVLLFAFHGTSAIPEMEVLTGRDPKLLRRAIIIGSLLPIALYLFFAFATVLVTGRATTELVTVGLGQVIGPRMIIVGNLFAVFAMCTSFVTIGQALHRTFQWDFGMRSMRALLCAVGIPFCVYVVGARQFVTVIAIVGGVFGTIELFLIVWAYIRAHNLYEKSSYSRRRIWWS